MKEKKDDGIDKVLRSCAAAGIAGRYMTMKLRDPQFGKEGERLWKLLMDEDELFSLINGGQGFAFIGSQIKTHSLAMVLLKGIHMCGYAVRAVSLMQLVDLMEDREKLAHVTTDVKVLGIAAFYVDDYAGDESPLTKRQRAQIEEYLFQWMEDQRSLVIQSTTTLSTMKWWSRGLRDLIKSNVQVMPL